MDAVTLDNRQVAAARRGGLFAARMGQPATACPYAGDREDVAALRRVWLAAYLRQLPPPTGSVDYTGD